MTYLITSTCIGCATCAYVCKNEAIDYSEGLYVIEPSKCDSCGTCLEYCLVENTIVEIFDSVPD
jgi:ferredoxin